MNYRTATLEEREKFYSTFKPDELNLMNFKPQFFAIDLGSKTRIAKFPEKKDQLIMLPPNLSFEELKKKLIYYLPENVYYDRNIYKDANAFFAGKKFKNFWEDKNYIGQELCFDVDAENIEEPNITNEEKYTNLLKKAAKKSIKIADILKEQGFKDLSFVYSGKGFHVKVHDKDSEKLSFKERTVLNDLMKGLPIDRWVSGGHSKLIRLPFSLHGFVSRTVIQLKEEEMLDFNPSNDARTIPRFLH